MMTGSESVRGSTSDPEINERFGPYELVARLYRGTHHGVLWRAGQKIIEVTATTNAGAKDLIEKQFYELRLKQAGERDDATPGEQEFLKALSYIWPHLNPSQQRMLTAQYHASERRLSTLEMAEVAGYKSHHPVNLFYGQAGLMLFSELPRVLPINKQTGTPIYSFALSTGFQAEVADRSVWIWEMRPEVAKGLELGGLVTAS